MYVYMVCVSISKLNRMTSDTFRTRNSFYLTFASVHLELYRCCFHFYFFAQHRSLSRDTMRTSTIASIAVRVWCTHTHHCYSIATATTTIALTLKPTECNPKLGMPPRNIEYGEFGHMHLSYYFDFVDFDFTGVGNRYYITSYLIFIKDNRIMIRIHIILWLFLMLSPLRGQKIWHMTDLHWFVIMLLYSVNKNSIKLMSWKRSVKKRP